ncbi:MAG TPA: PKD domain-containing protein, partial [Gemmatimonadales bacterium]
EGGMVISASSGVAASGALGAHQSATGTASTTSPEGPGAIPVSAGALAYAFTMADGPVGSDPPAGFTNITEVSDDTLKADGEYDVVPSAGTVDPKWNWYFTSPHSWLATALALNPATPTPNQPPVAAFTSSCSYLACAFTNGSSDSDGTISASAWNFGDGTTSTAASPSHSYGAAGTYTVTLTVTDNQGATSTVSHAVTVTAPNTAPVVNAGPDETVLLGVLYTLNASFTDPDNGPWTYTINWGDGSTSTGSAASAGPISAGHSYLGFLTTRTITVTVTDSQGASGSDTKVITLIL